MQWFMKALILTALAIVSASPLVAQTEHEHAPLAAQCQADVGLWANVELVKEFDDDASHKESRITKLGLGEVIFRSKEMGQCVHVDPSRADEYRDARDVYNDARHERMENFIYRHHLMRQLRAEDEAGIR